VDRLSGGRVVPHQRKSDGFVNATALCGAGGKLWADYSRLGSTAAFVTELSAVMGIPITEVVQVREGGAPAEQGTWVHPDVAIHLAQWCSPRFAVHVSRWVRELLPKVEWNSRRRAATIFSTGSGPSGARRGHPP
jgi:hypothetical protein